MKSGDYVVYESTVYPGCTEEDCLPILEKISGLKISKDFKLGYSPERINPGDKQRKLPNILKIVAACDEESTAECAKVYGEIIKAGIYKAPSIKVAEAAKVIENTQRDLNISLMNELSIIFDKMGIDTQAVIEAAGTKWNFLKFSPGLVGGHCISVDPYYLLHKAKQMGYDPQVIAAGRRINDEMPRFVAKKLVQTLIEKGKNPGESKVLIMGVTFKEDVSDIRNSKVFDLVKELMDYSLVVEITDPYASAEEVELQFKKDLLDTPNRRYDAIVIAVAHKTYRVLQASDFKALLCCQNPILFDLKGILLPNQLAELSDVNFWRL